MPTPLPSGRSTRVCSEVWQLLSEFAYACPLDLLAPTLISRPLAGAPPTIDLALGYSETNTSPLLRCR